MDINKELIEKYQDGDMAAFKEIYDKTSKFIYNVILKMVKSEEEAEDLSHDIFVKLHEKRSLYNGSVKFTTWAYQIATNHTINHIKRKNSFTTKLGDLFLFNKENKYEPEYQVFEEDKNNEIHIALQKIKPDFRICLVLKEFEEKSYDEIAEILGITLGTVKSRINRAKQQFKKVYKQEVSYAKTTK